MRYAYPRARDVAALATDLLLLGVVAAIVLLRFGGALGAALGCGIACVLVLGVVTLHFPRAVEIDDEGIAFFGYGRVHRFAWADTEVRVRRFLVGDRVLVRLLPSSPLRGRYWILDAMGDYPALVATLEARSHRKS